MEYPSEAKYMRVKNYNDKVLARHTTRISPFNGSEFGPSQVDRILFNIPSETGMEIDMDTMMFHFTATLSLGADGAADTDDIYFNNSIESVIQNLRIRKGTSFLLEDIQRYNYLDSIFMNWVSKDYNDTVGAATMGICDTHERIKLHRTIEPNAAANDDYGGFYDTALVSRNYSIPFRLSGISNYSGLISTSLIDSVCAFQFEIELAPAKQAIQAYRRSTHDVMGAPIATATYKLTECYISYDVVRMAPEYHQQLQASIQRGIPLQIPYKTWRTSMYTISTTDGQSKSFNINDTVKSLNSVFVAFFKQDEQDKFTVAGRDRKHRPNLKDAQLQLGSFYYPLQPMDCTNGASQAFLECQKAMGLSFIRSEYTGPVSFKGQDYFGPAWNNTQNLVTGIAGGANAAAQKYPTHVKDGVTYAGLEANAVFADNTYALVTTADAAGARRSSRRLLREAAASSPSEFLIGFNLRKVLDAVEGEIVGTDIQSSGSGLMTLRLNFTGNPDTNYHVIVASLYDAVLEIQSNQQTFRVE